MTHKLHPSTLNDTRRLAPATRTTFAIWLIMILMCSPALQAAQSAADLLPQQQAFRLVSTSADIDMLHLRWDIADGYYLYRDKFRFEALDASVRLGQAVFPAGELKDDPNFGPMEIYRGAIAIDIPILALATSQLPGQQLHLRVTTQGCADIGLCYAPHNELVQIELPQAPAKRADTGFLAGLSALGQKLGLTGLTPKFLAADEAYVLSVDVIDGHTLQAHWDIADGYYLYRDKISFNLLAPTSISLAQTQRPPGKIKEDEYFGIMQVYYDQADITIPLQRRITSATPASLEVAYQGCAEAGFCYPPISKVIEINLPAATNNAATKLLPLGALAEQDRIAKLLASDRALLTALGLFGIGILLAFTPCVFPMVPILSSILVGQGDKITTRRAFTLSLVYVLAMASTYTAAGVIAGLFGENLQILFQTPWVIISFSIIFVILALAMFGLYDLQIPHSWQTHLHLISNKQRSGSYFGVAIMGVLSALIVGPCIAAPLAGVLIYIGLSGDAAMGGFSLFMLSLGMGTPLLIIGTSAGKLLPRAGHWMNSIKAFFGVMLLALAIWMLERILDPTITMFLWSALFIASAVFMGALARLEPEATSWQKLSKASGLVMLVYGSIILIGAASGGNDILHPLQHLTSPSKTSVAATHIGFQRIKNLDELNQAVAGARARQQTVMLDFYADWCVECKKMEKATFANASVQQVLAKTLLLQADVTANDAQDQALLKQFGLFGPPAVIFFDRFGHEISRSRLIGFLDATDFRQHIEAAFALENQP